MASLNDLEGYAMVFSYSESMLNTKLESEFNLGGNHLIPNSLEVPSENKGKIKFEEFGAPVLSFDTPPKSQTCKLTIPIVQGAMEYFGVDFDKDGAPVVKTYRHDFSGRHLTITTPVRQRKHDDFTDSNFTIQSIYADLSQVTDATVDFDDKSVDHSISVASSIDVGVKKALKKYVADYRSANSDRNPTVFGGVRVPQKTQTYDLRPTSCTYSITVDTDSRGRYITGALNLLMQINNEPLPSSTAAGFIDHLITPHGVKEGTLVISSYAFSKQVVLKYLHETKEYKAFNLGAQHAKDGKQGGLVLNKDYTQSVDKATLTHKGFTGEFIYGGYRISQDIGATVDYWSGDDHYVGSFHVDVDFHLDDNDNLTCTTGALVKSVRKVPDDFWTEFLKGFAMGVTLGIDAGAREAWTSGVEGDLTTVAGKVTAPTLNALECIILPGGKTGVFDYTSVQVHKAVNEQYNLMLRARFA